MWDVTGLPMRIPFRDIVLRDPVEGQEFDPVLTEDILLAVAASAFWASDTALCVNKGVGTTVNPDIAAGVNTVVGTTANTSARLNGNAGVAAGVKKDPDTNAKTGIAFDVQSRLQGYEEWARKEKQDDLAKNVRAQDKLAKKTVGKMRHRLQEMQERQKQEHQQALERMDDLLKQVDQFQEMMDLFRERMELHLEE